MTRQVDPLDGRIREALAVLVDEAPAPPPFPQTTPSAVRRRTSSPVVAVVVAACVVALGVVGGLLMAGGEDRIVVTTPRPLLEPDRPEGWRELPAAPLAARGGAEAVWTGRELLVWGGGTPTSEFADGAAYDPQTDTWQLLPEGPLGPRQGHSAVWTGGEMIVWGGASGNPGSVLDQGAAFDPEQGVWRTLTPAPISARSDHVAVWTGAEMIVFGGAGADGAPFRDGARYRPDTDSWEPIAPLEVESTSRWGAGHVVWGGDALFVIDLLPGEDPQSSIPRAFRYDPAGDSWAELSRPPGDWAVEVDGETVVDNLFFVWSGEHLIGLRSMPTSSSPHHGLFPSGLLYTPATDTWQTTPDPPTGFSYATRPAWTGAEVLLLAGSDEGDAVAYHPQLQRWRRVPGAPVPARSAATVAATNSEIIIWGGIGTSPDGAITAFADGAAYTPPPDRSSDDRDDDLGAPSSAPEHADCSQRPSGSRPAVFDPSGGTFAAQRLTVQDPNHLRFDIVQWLSGEEANEAYFRETGDDTGAPNDYFIVNETAELHVAAVAEDAAIYVLRADGHAASLHTAASLTELPTDDPERTFWLTFASGAITEICQQYRP